MGFVYDDQIPLCSFKVCRLITGKLIGCDYHVILLLKRERNTLSNAFIVVLTFHNYRRNVEFLDEFSIPLLSQRRRNYDQNLASSLRP
ncbi:hypothetical protein D3C75_908060 [compost metagenome]